MNRRRILISFLLGTTLSLALAALGPLIIPQYCTITHNEQFQWRARSWLITEYHSNAPRADHAPTTAAVVELLTSPAYPRAGFPPPVQPAPDWRFWTLHQSGFPLRSVQGWSIHLMTIAPPLPKEFGPTHSGYLTIREGARESWQERLLYSPIWSGLIANALLFSAIIWLTLAATAAARRTIRKRRHRCPNCNYDLRATPPNTPCPECGHNRSTASQ